MSGNGMENETSSRRGGILRRLLELLSVAIFALLAAQQPGLSEELSGDVWIIDGDTVQIGSTMVHLGGIDSPELGQRCVIEDKEWRCGLEAALALRKLVAFGGVICTSEESGPTVTGACAAAGKDLAEALLNQGYAVAAPEALPAYQGAEAAAQAAELGLWRGDFVRPEDWRRGARLPDQASDTVFCVVKGTVTSEGQKIFYIPSDEEYRDIAIESERGERLFCSDDEAILAGWTRFPRERP
jgi:endonuclease YncB( thermonuclease family)